MFLWKKPSENYQKLLEIKSMTKFSTERLKDKAKEISQKIYLRERKKEGMVGENDRDKKINNLWSSILPKNPRF